MFFGDLGQFPRAKGVVGSSVSRETRGGCRRGLAIVSRETMSGRQLLGVLFHVKHRRVPTPPQLLFHVKHCTAKRQRSRCPELCIDCLAALRVDVSRETICTGIWNQLRDNGGVARQQPPNDSFSALYALINKTAPNGILNLEHDYKFYYYDVD